MFESFRAYLCEQWNEWKRAFLGIRNSILTTRYLQIPCLINSQPAVGQFEYFSFPTSFDIKITGWKPIVWTEGNFVYVSGLPSKPKADIRLECSSSEGRASSKVIKANSKPDWEQIFNELTEDCSLD